MSSSGRGSMEGLGEAGKEAMSKDEIELAELAKPYVVACNQRNGKATWINRGDSAMELKRSVRTMPEEIQLMIGIAKKLDILLPATVLEQGTSFSDIMNAAESAGKYQQFLVVKNEAVRLALALVGEVDVPNVPQGQR